MRTSAFDEIIEVPIAFQSDGGYGVVYLEYSLWLEDAMNYVALFIVICVFLGLLGAILDEIRKTNRNLEKILQSEYLQFNNPSIAENSTGSEPQPDD
jgi:hypothetical protein